jgi:hypothetical protein
MTMPQPPALPQTHPQPVMLPQTHPQPVMLPPTPMGTQAVTPGGMLVPPKLAQRIWRGEFVDMLELSPERLGQAEDRGNQTGEGESKK